MIRLPTPTPPPQKNNNKKTNNDYNAAWYQPQCISMKQTLILTLPANWNYYHKNKSNNIMF